MPCAAINNIDDRDYIKSLKKNVLVGNDGEEKACLCQCKVPTTSEGCPILDENNKELVYKFLNSIILSVFILIFTSVVDSLCFRFIK